jgi:hypothetical protein
MLERKGFKVRLVNASPGSVRLARLLIFPNVPENLKLRTVNPFVIGGEEKLGHKRPEAQKQRLNKRSTTTSCRFVELYERRMRSF